jgi:hypothetical protein
MGVKRPNGRKIDQITIKYRWQHITRPSKNLPKLGFLFENMPSGNPVLAA